MQPLPGMKIKSYAMTGIVFDAGEHASRRIRRCKTGCGCKAQASGTIMEISGRKALVHVA